MTDASTNLILQEIKRNKDELKNELTNAINASEARLRLDIEGLKNRIVQLEEENNTLKNKLEKLERKTRSNNIVLFGLNKECADITTGYLIAELKNLFGVDVLESDINNYYCLGKTINSPVKIEFVSNLKTKAILTNAYKLKNTKVAVSKDLSEEQREELRELKVYMQKKREEGHKCFIRGNKLNIEGSYYTREELLNISEEAIKPNSAPSTPTVHIEAKPNQPKPTVKNKNSQESRNLRSNSTSDSTNSPKAVPVVARSLPSTSRNITRKK